jgi:hypothetical protein
VSVAVAERLPVAAVIVVVPAPAPTACPDPSIVATLWFEDDHAMVAATGEPDPFCAVALND